LRKTKIEDRERGGSSPYPEEFIEFRTQTQFAIRLGTLKDTDKLPAESKRYPHDILVVVTPTEQEDDYSF
jgi:hypothetical protein